MGFTLIFLYFHFFIVVQAILELTTLWLTQPPRLVDQRHAHHAEFHADRCVMCLVMSAFPLSFLALLLDHFLFLVPLLHTHPPHTPPPHTHTLI